MMMQCDVESIIECVFLQRNDRKLNIIQLYPQHTQHTNVEQIHLPLEQYL